MFLNTFFSVGQPVQFGKISEKQPIVQGMRVFQQNGAKRIEYVIGPTENEEVALLNPETKAIVCKVLIATLREKFTATV